MDSTYYLSFVFIWSMIEGYVAVIFASVPPLRQLVRLIFPSVLNTTHTYPNGNIGSFYNNQSSRKNQATGTDIEIGSIHPNLSANTSEEGLAPKVLKESSHQPR